MVSLWKQANGGAYVQSFGTDFKNTLVPFPCISELIPLPVNRHLIECEQQGTRYFLVENIRTGEEVDLVGDKHRTLDNGVHQSVLVIAYDDGGLILLRQVFQSFYTLNAVKSIESRLDQLHGHAVADVTSVDGRLYE